MIGCYTTFYDNKHCHLIVRKCPYLTKFEKSDERPTNGWTIPLMEVPSRYIAAFISEIKAMASRPSIVYRSDDDKQRLSYLTHTHKSQKAVFRKSGF